MSFTRSRPDHRLRSDGRAVLARLGVVEARREPQQLGARQPSLLHGVEQTCVVSDLGRRTARPPGISRGAVHAKPLTSLVDDLGGLPTLTATIFRKLDRQPGLAFLRVGPRPRETVRGGPRATQRLEPREIIFHRRDVE